jgi:hypothetical protein
MTLLPQSGKGWRGVFIRLGILLAVLSLFLAYMIVMPGRSYSGPAIQPSLATS